MEFEDGPFSGNEDFIENLKTGCRLLVPRTYERVNEDDILIKKKTITLIIIKLFRSFNV